MWGGRAVIGKVGGLSGDLPPPSIHRPGAASELFKTEAVGHHGSGGNDPLSGGRSWSHGARPCRAADSETTPLRRVHGVGCGASRAVLM